MKLAEWNKNLRFDFLPWTGSTCYSSSRRGQGDNIDAKIENADARAEALAGDRLNQDVGFLLVQ